ncbi:larval cuticle protein LCP-22-like [Rhynchophorus ferrugineus]|uniref:larval cuticle protein LCP-22-like n=1 Tax=Rhynchophorus ferrugineus TaxID=354439 RepID=UPI003FCD3F03
MQLIVLAAIVSLAACLPPVPNQYLVQKQPAILRSYSDIKPDGSYRYSYQTENGIVAQERGYQRYLPSGAGTVARGSYRYTSPEGRPIVVSYVADQNGFRPISSALPTPPPVPAAILRALDYIARQKSETSTAKN